MTDHAAIEQFRHRFMPGVVSRVVTLADLPRILEITKGMWGASASPQKDTDAQEIVSAYGFLLCYGATSNDTKLRERFQQEFVQHRPAQERLLGERAYLDVPSEARPTLPPVAAPESQRGAELRDTVLKITQGCLHIAAPCENEFAACFECILAALSAATAPEGSPGPSPAAPTRQEAP